VALDSKGFRSLICRGFLGLTGHPDQMNDRGYTRKRNEWHGGRSLDHDLKVDFAALVRSSLDAGDTPDQIAQALIKDHRLLPISAIKALRSGGGMTSDEAKEVIKRNLPADQWAAAEGLWETIARSETGVNDDA
jgi:hypothetical protein